MELFEYNTNPSRVVFGSGSIQKLPAEVARLNLSSPLLLSTPQQVQQAEQLKFILNGRVAGIFAEATMHTPTHITNKALAYAQKTKADSVVSIGGGSTIGLGKAIRKTTRSDPKILPWMVIYDVDLTMTLPTGLTATSGVNAIAHAGA